MTTNQRQTVHSGLVCPNCGLRRMVVIDSRVQAGSVRRRRKCMDCNFRVTTYEVTAFEKRLIDEWVKRIKEVRELTQKLVTGLDDLAGSALRSAQERVTMHDMTARDLIQDRRQYRDDLAGWMS